MRASFYAGFPVVEIARAIRIMLGSLCASRKTARINAELKPIEKDARTQVFCYLL